MKINDSSMIKKNLQKVLILMGMIAIVFSTSCKKDECEDPPAQPNTLDEMISLLDLQTLPEVSFPANNQHTTEKSELGRLLFWDPIVGGQKDVACVTCHHPGLGYGDGIDLAIGVNGSGLGPDRTENTGGLPLDIERVPRNAPTIINSAYNGLTSSNGYDPLESPMFWDSRFNSLETQCQKPPTSRSEMRGDAYSDVDAMDSIVLRLAAIPEYVQLFTEVFGTNNPMTVENYAKAVADFERTIVSTNSPYDRYLKGDLSALTDDQKNGLILFNGKARCSNCHFGPMLSDYDVHALGIPENPNSPLFPADSGKFHEFKFRTPTLRNATLTGPYMHNGMMESIKDVVEYMNEGVSGNDNVTADMLATDMAPLGLTEKEIDQIVAFIESLTDENFDQVVPESVPSGLEVGGNIN
jgi:cytochrome c peroxidase